MPLISLDSRALDFPLKVRLSDEDLRAVESLQSELLCPLDHPTVDAWRAAVNRALMAATGGDAAMFQLMLPGLDPHFTEELSMTILEDYPEVMPELEQTRKIFRRSLRLGAGNRFLLWKNHLEWLYSSEYFNEMIVKLRAFDTLWATAPVGDSQYPAMLHAYHEQRDRGPRFDEKHVQMMRMIRPALEAGAKMVARAFGHRTSLTTSLDGQEDGAFVLGVDGRLLHRNPAVSRLAVTVVNERVLEEEAREMARALLGEELPTLLAPSAVSRCIHSGGRPYRLNAVRMREGLFALGPAVLVTVASRETVLPDRDALCERFGLTRRQSEVALLLARRMTNSEIAERLCISPHTARRHTEAVIGRLGIHDRRKVGVVISTRLQDPEHVE